ncbi:MAG: bifunctional [glutamine synthetase] adenylyltransferase/[glutamine synthetase]-adenylyl-L-tyrosine phosphorylase [Proteobacteria bacterium]|nr:bifunctional [glutamine synthetase] adenylyltransferase/[glutamine synthetase]-adenylyl-L-tyrosine phosphorylase [Pseudomonadota bacterium]
MPSYPLLSAIRALPAAGIPERVPVALERWHEAAARTGAEAFARDLAADPTGAALLAAIFGNSPFLTEGLLADVEAVRALAQHGPDRTFAEILGSINDDLAAQPTGMVMHALRAAKRRAAVTIALADIAGIWPLERVTESLSALAEAALDVAAIHALGLGCTAPGEPIERAGLGTLRDGLVILAMGKLGARELNYSSDIDLVVLYDEERIAAGVRAAFGRHTAAQFYIRLVRNLVKVMEERTPDGYVFRTDLRLRPDPGSTPAAISVLAAETYYETVGQNWERAAMIKARPVAGDRAAGQAFLRHLRPFLWRKNLDFAAINDIHSIKRQINAHKRIETDTLLGLDVKLGHGGIREIEFFAQTQQLIWGGRDPSLRIAGTCAALHALAAVERVDPATVDALEAAYRFLRQVEHRLQMVDDQQTHRLPADATGFARMAAFLGFASGDAFAAELRRQLDTVSAHYAQLFEEAPSLSGPGNLVFTGTDDDPETTRTLKAMGFRNASGVSAVIRGWHHGRLRATRSVRARELLTELMPTLLTALARERDPDLAFARFDNFLANLPGGVQLFAQLYSNPQQLDRIAEIMGAAPALADYLGRHPQLLDSLLSDSFGGAAPDQTALRDDLDRALQDADDLQDVLDLIRRWSGDRKFLIGTGMLRGTVAVVEAARQLSDIADAAIAALVPAVERTFAALHGHVPGGVFAVVALGKLGARELTVTSDLDLVFIYEPGDDTLSDGRKPLPAVSYFARLGQRLISALTAPTAEGELFRVDMRLRPTGNKGPIAVSLDYFLRYQHGEAWSWEHMALSRARVIAASPGFGARVEHAILEVVARPRDAERLVVDVADMRKRIAHERPRPKPFDVKNRRGGLIDVEFIAQYLLLRHAHSHPGLITGNTEAALGRLGDRGLLAPERAQALQRAARLWQAIQGYLRLATGGELEADLASTTLKQGLARACDVIDYAALQHTIAASAAAVTAAYRELIDDPAAFARKHLKEEKVS